MPTVKEIKAELKTLKIKGVTGKTKAQLVAMLPEGNCFKVACKSKAPAPAPAPAPVPIKAPAPRRVVATAVANPVRPVVRTIKKEMLPEIVEEVKVPSEKPIKKSTSSYIERSGLSEENQKYFNDEIDTTYPTSMNRLYDDYNKIKRPSYGKSEIEYKLWEIEGTLLNRNEGKRDERARIKNYFKNVMKKVNIKTENARVTADIVGKGFSKSKVISRSELMDIIYEPDE